MGSTARPVPLRVRAGAVALAACLGGVLGAGLPGPADADPPTVSTERFYQAAVNIPPETPGAGGVTGSVVFHLPVGGSPWVEIFLSDARTVVCADGEESTASTTVTTTPREATTPGPVTLEIDRRLRTAQGHALLDLEVTDDPGCAEPTTTRTESAAPVSIDVTGSTPRFTTGVGGSTRSGSDLGRDLAHDLSRDGTGTVRVGSLVSAQSEAAFLKYSVVRSRTHGTPPVAPDPAAPPGGRGAQGAFSASFEPDGPGLLLTDAIVQAGTTAPPERATTVTASSFTVARVVCADGTQAEVAQLLDGAGPGSLDVPRSLGSAFATATVRMTRIVVDGCDPDAPAREDLVDVPVTLDLTADGPAVRVRNVRWHGPRAGGVDRTNEWYVARQATGTVAVGDAAGTTGIASIARAGR